MALYHDLRTAASHVHACTLTVAKRCVLPVRECNMHAWGRSWRTDFVEHCASQHAMHAPPAAAESSAAILMNVRASPASWMWKVRPLQSRNRLRRERAAYECDTPPKPLKTAASTVNSHLGITMMVYQQLSQSAM